MRKRSDKNIRILLSALLLLAAGFWHPVFGGGFDGTADPATGGDDGARSYIIVFGSPPARTLRSLSLDRTADPAALVKEQLQDQIRASYPLIDGALADLTAEQAESLASEPGVAFVEPDYPVHALGQTVPWGVERIYDSQSYPFEAWETTSGAGIRVAVLDSGIQGDHEDLPALAGGVNTVDGSAWNVDDNGHGTHVAGIVAAQMNQLGVVGTAPAAALYSVKVLDSEGDGWISDIIEGIQWAVENDIQIISMSLGTTLDSTALKTACDAAWSSGHLLFAAAGNNGNEEDKSINYPAAFSSVIAVGATDNSDQRASFSAIGPELELMAPGQEILSTYPAALQAEAYKTVSGTSMAIPHAAGAAAVIWASEPEFTNVQIREILNGTGLDLGLLQSQQGSGLIQLNKALDLAEDIAADRVLALSDLRHDAGTGRVEADLELRVPKGTAGQVFFALYDAAGRFLNCTATSVVTEEYAQALSVSETYSTVNTVANAKAFFVGDGVDPLGLSLEISLP